MKYIKPLEAWDYAKDIDGVIVKHRVCMMIPREVEKFPDYGPRKCVYCGADLPPRRRKYCCDECANKYRRATRPWIYIDWKTFRSAVMHRDKFTCQKCDISKWGAMEVHHITPLHCGGDEFDPENCITLCKDCHKERHRFRKLEGTKISQMRLEELE